jgi:pimeloyl-ACP methyl ester carboxylesterase
MTGRALLLGGTAALLSGTLAAAARRREALAEATYPPQGRILDVGGVPVHVLVRGEGPDLVMLHGASGNLREFTFDLIPRLEHRFRCIAIDRPGLGYTGRTRAAYDAAWTGRAESPAEQAALLATAYAQVGRGDPIVLGHSFGGTVALAWALDHPARALLLLAAPAMVWPGGLGPLYRFVGSPPGGALAVPLLTAFVSDAYIEAVTHRIFAPQPVPPGYGAHIGARLTTRRASLRANVRQLERLKPRIAAMQARYDALTLPIEWIHGAADRIVPPEIHAHPFARRVPQTRLTMLDGVGHMPHHVRPDAVHAALDRLTD